MAPSKSRDTKEITWYFSGLICSPHLRRHRVIPPPPVIFQNSINSICSLVPRCNYKWGPPYLNIASRDMVHLFPSCFLTPTATADSASITDYRHLLLTHSLTIITLVFQNVLVILELIFSTNPTSVSAAWLLQLFASMLFSACSPTCFSATFASSSITIECRVLTLFVGGSTSWQ